MGVRSEPGGDAAHGEIVENELARLIEKRHDRRVAEEGQSREELLAHHEARAEKLQATDERRTA